MIIIGKYIAGGVMLSLVICFTITMVLVYFTHKNPLYLPASYLFLSNFFVTSLPVLNTSKLYLLLSLISIIIKIFKKEHTVKIYKYSALLMALFFMSLAIPPLFHLLFHGPLPALYMSPLIKSSWWIVFLLLPAEKFETKSIINSMELAAIFTLLLISIESVPYYLQTGNSLGRDLMTKIDGIRNFGIGKKYWFVMDDNTSENISIFLSATIASTVYYLRHYQMKEFLPRFLFLLFSGWILFINQYALPLIIFTVSLIIGLICMLKSWKKRLIISLVIIIPITLIFNRSTVYHMFENKFRVYYLFGNKKTDDEVIKNMNRLTLFYTTAKNLLLNEPIKGFGHVQNFNELNYQKDGNITYTGHSTILDNLLSFGIPIGLLANSIYLLPLLFLIQRLKKINFQHRSQTSYLLFTLNIFLISFVTIFGRESLQIGSFLTLLTIYWRCFATNWGLSTYKIITIPQINLQLGLFTKWRPFKNVR